MAVHEQRGKQKHDGSEEEDELGIGEYVPVKKRRLMAALQVRRRGVGQGGIWANTASELTPILIAKSLQLKQDALFVARREAKLAAEEKAMIDRLSTRKTLICMREVPKGISYTKPMQTEPMQTGWKPPLPIRSLGKEDCDEIRRHLRISGEGDDIPPPVQSFKDMRFPEPVLAQLKAKGITRPTPMQMQGLPVVLSGRDMIGVAFPGSGKTLVFALPFIMFALQEEERMPLVGGEGPLAVVVCPSRALARQTLDLVEEFTSALARNGHPQLRSMLCVAGVDMSSQVMHHGVHIAVATPGPLRDMLAEKKMNLDICKHLAVDEADRFVDLRLGFEDEALGHFKGPQIVMFSATMPKETQDFAKAVLVNPVVVRAGAANLDVVQEFECVKQEARMVSLLERLQKTAPPVSVFCENKVDVDDIHEYLRLKGVKAVGIHGGKEQEERDLAVSAFKAGREDVLVATDAASEGRDFPDIQHVINYDMPAEIETYVRRIARTGRCGKTGIATTFINKNQGGKILLDLKHLLKEAKQRIPPVLATLDDPMEECILCGTNHSS